LLKYLLICCGTINKIETKGIIKKNFFCFVRKNKYKEKKIIVGPKKISCGLIKIPRNRKKVAYIKNRNLFVKIVFTQNAKEIKNKENANDPVKIFNEIFKEIIIKTKLIKR
tara:strand:+ start:462 stop:794 length:333 start_codon:yes stop_codon:yes gene_type:complete